MVTNPVKVILFCLYKGCSNWTVVMLLTIQNINILDGGVRSLLQTNILRSCKLWNQNTVLLLVVMNLKKSHLLILEVIICDVIQLREETSVGGILGAVEDALEDGLVLSIDVVVLQGTEDVSNKNSTITYSSSSNEIYIYITTRTQ